MKDTTYNGWTNYETWLVNLWIDNEPYSSEHFANIAGDLTGSYDREDAIVRLEEIIEDDVREWAFSQLEQNSMRVDLLNASLSKVDWQEIASHYVDEWINMREEDAA